MTVEELQVLITAKTNGLRDEINKAQGSLLNLEQKATKTSDVVSKGFNFIKASIIGAGIGLLLNQVNKGLDGAISRVDTLNNYSNIMSNLGIAREDSILSINRLSDALQGLPTTLDDAALSVQRFTSANGNIKASTEMFLALNNAILAGGASQEIQRSALEQLSQSYAKGKPDMVEWRSAMTAMPAQLKQVAMAMGYVNSDALGEALRNGEVSMNEFMVTLTKLNKQGVNGFASFEEQARNATGGIATSMTNVKTAMTRGLADIMNAIGQSNIASFFQGIARAINSVVPYITAFVKVCKTAVSYITALFGGKVQTNTDKTTTSLSNLGNTAGSTTSSGLDKATGSAKKLNKELNGLSQFDEMNVLQEPNNNKSGSGDTGSSGVGDLGEIDLSAFDTSIKETSNKVDELYNKMMDSLKWFTSDMNFNPLVNSIKNLGSAIDYLVGGFSGLLRDFIANCLKPLATYTVNDALPHFFNSTAEAIKDVDFGKLSISLNDLYKSLVPFAKNVGDGLLWFYDKVLIPIGLYTVNNIVPEFLTMLSKGITILNNTIDTVKPAISFLWENFLSPVAKWTGGVAVTVLKDINNVLGLIAKSKVASTITALSSAFLLVKSSGTTLKGLLSKLFTSTKDVNDVMSSKSSGLGGILKSLGKTMSNFLSPTKQLLTNIVNIKSRTKDLSKELKTNNTLWGGFKTTITSVKTKVVELKTSITKIGKSLKTTASEVKNGITYWYQTSTAMDKLKTGVTGLAGTVISLQGFGQAIKQISDEGANFGNVATTVVSGIGSIASGAMAGASVAGPFGALIGGIGSGIGLIVQGLSNWNMKNQEVTNLLASSTETYTNYKTQMDDINNTLATTVATAQRSADVKMVEIANAQSLAGELENFIDVNGRVKSGYEERASVILNDLNTALGTEFTLEGNVIKNGNEMINSKQRFIDVVKGSAEAIQKETLLQSYQAQYKAAIEAQIDAKRAYKKALEEENTILEKAIEKYNNGKISATELQNVYDKATKNTKSATDKYKSTLKETDTIIGGLEKVTKSYADGSYKDMKKTVDGITGTNKTSLTETEKSYKTTTTKIGDMLKGAKKESDKLKKSFDEFHNKTFKGKMDINTSPARGQFNRLADDINKSSTSKNGLNVKINKIPAYARGGIVDKPTYAMIGEAGKEAVMPLERNTGWIDQLASKIADKNGGGNTPTQIVVKIGEETIYEKFIDYTKDKNFEQNGEWGVNL